LALPSLCPSLVVCVIYAHTMVGCI